MYVDASERIREDGGRGGKGRGSGGVRAKKKVPPVQSTKGTSQMMGSMDV